MEEWEPLRDEYLDALLAREAPPEGRAPMTCSAVLIDGEGKPSICNSPNPLYRCRDCFDHGVAVCGACCATRHALNPFHRIQVRLIPVLWGVETHGIDQKWNQEFYEDISLVDTGFASTLYLGHNGAQCPNTFFKSSTTLMTVFHANGWHKVPIGYCACGTTTKRLQLLAAALYPASVTDPKTAFTFEFLNTFHILTLQGKLTLYDYYTAVTRLTDNMGLGPRIVSSAGCYLYVSH